MSAANKNYGLGHRKEAVAKVYLSAGTGKYRLFTGNSEEKRERGLKEYFFNDFLIESILQPITLVGKKESFDVDMHVSGGGICAQAGALRLAISKALLEADPYVKYVLKTYKLLTQDRRFKERKKVGKRGARRSPQFTKR